MTLIALVVVLAAIGYGLYWLSSSTKLNPTVKTLLNVVLIGTAIVLVLSAIGVWDEIRKVQIPRL